MHASRRRYLVRFFVQDIVGVEVEAPNADAAKQLAEEQVRKHGLWRQGLKPMRGLCEYVGFDDLTFWEEISLRPLGTYGPDRSTGGP